MAPAPALRESVERLLALVGEKASPGPLADRELVAALEAVGDARRRLDALGAAIAGEVATRSELPDEESLARRLGERSPAALVERIAGVDEREARDWCAAGVATGPRRSLSGEPLPARHPVLADSLRAGEMSVRATSLVAAALEEVALLTSLEERSALEAFLVERAPQFTVRELARLCRQLPERFDAAGEEFREQRLRDRSGVRVARTADGLVRWVVTMHPEAAGFITAAVDARTAPRRRVVFSESEPGVAEPGASDPGDGRTTPQRRLDALVSIARESLARDPGEVAGAPVTMLVTVPLDALRSGLGAARIAGVDEPVSARTARRLAADADLVPVVLGGESEVLDLGRARRLFSTAQRRALAVRDGGCIWPGCDVPPAWCEVAHLEPWLDGGPTDLRNGALLCPFHHRRFDLDGWTLRWRDGERWLHPPPWVDSALRARRAGREPAVA